MVDRMLSRSHLITSESVELNEGGGDNNNNNKINEYEEIERKRRRDKCIERMNRKGAHKHYLLINSHGLYAFCGQGYNLIWLFHSFIHSSTIIDDCALFSLSYITQLLPFITYILFVFFERYSL